MKRGKNNTTTDQTNAGRIADFSYMGDDTVYLCIANQSLRPQPVIAALENYYKTYNACGGRVKYAWGQKVDGIIEETRAAVLKLLNASAKDYVTSFTLNTTYGLNLILQQLPMGAYQRIVTSEIEHNSVFLPTMTTAQRLGIERIVLPRAIDGSLDYEPVQLTQAVVVLNAVSNIDGRALRNIQRVIADTHERGGIVIIDAAQAMAHSHELLRGCGADAICFSAHKMYAASLGVIVIRKDLLQTLTHNFVGGGMVSAVRENDFDLLPDDLSSRLEPGLQAFGEIIAFRAALQWLETVKPHGLSRSVYIQQLSEELYTGLKALPGVTMINQAAAPVISLYSDRYDAHRLAVFLSAANIMVRSGYFCCHYYLIEQRNLPPLVRFSLGLQTTSQDIQTTLATLKKIIGKA